jgi:hypothetical protein
VRGVEDAVLQHVVELEIRLDLRFVEVVFRLAHLLGVQLPVPRLELERCPPDASIADWMSAASVRARAVAAGTRSSRNLSAVAGFFAIWSSSFQAA